MAQKIITYIKYDNRFFVASVHKNCLKCEYYDYFTEDYLVDLWIDGGENVTPTLELNLAQFERIGIEAYKMQKIEPKLLYNLAKVNRKPLIRIRDCSVNNSLACRNTEYEVCCIIDSGKVFYSVAKQLGIGGKNES